MMLPRRHSLSLCAFGLFPPRPGTAMEHPNFAGAQSSWLRMNPESAGFYRNRRADTASTWQLAIDQIDAAIVPGIPHPAALQEITNYSHSTLLYCAMTGGSGLI
jgi:hypothetical protein